MQNALIILIDLEYIFSIPILLVQNVKLECKIYIPIFGWGAHVYKLMWKFTTLK